MSKAGDEIWVGKGIHLPTTRLDPADGRSATFVLKNRVAVYGGFKGGETSRGQRKPTLNITVLSGLTGVSGWLDASYHVVYAGDGLGSHTVLDGFTIRDGNGLGGTGWATWGAGIFNGMGNPTFRNLIIQANTAKDGAGFYTQGGSPSLSRVNFIGNAASSDGGGMYIDSVAQPALSDVLFKQNSATEYGGGLYSEAASPRLTRVTFDTNSADFAGGMYADSGAPRLTDVVFANNTATYSGGGLYNYVGGNSVLERVTFSGNKATTNYGAGVYNFQAAASFTNVTFIGNVAGSSGGGMENLQCSPVVNNATLTGNTAPWGAAINNEESSSTISNSIIWGNGSYGDVHNEIGTPSFSHSIVMGGCPASSDCTGVDDHDPMLGPLQYNGGWTKTIALGLGSSAIDAGSAATCETRDQRGVARPQGRGCDAGSYEVRAKTFTSVAAYDGEIRESQVSSGLGGTVNAGGSALRMGDDPAGRQYRLFLSFDTGALPNTAQLVFAKVVAKRAGPIYGNPLDLGLPTVDVRKPYFGRGPGLAASDFAAAGVPTAAAVVEESGTYSALIQDPACLLNINLRGTTQLRWRFDTASDLDTAADYIAFYSGNAAAANRPKLIVYYNP